MAGSATVDFPSQVQGGPSPASAMVGPNTRVRSKVGRLATQLDTLTFPDGAGHWAIGNTRTRISGVAMISRTSVGQYVPASGTPSPLTVTAPNTKIRSA